MSKNIIMIDEGKCVGCNNCIRLCPVTSANRSVNIDGKNVIVIEPKDCIHCGSCIKGCAHGARYYIDDVENLFNDLKGGKKISLIIAPAIRTNFPMDYKRLLTYFKKCGVNKIYDTSFGAEITTWAYLKHIKETGIEGLVSQPCPAIVNYIQRYEPGLLEKLSPVNSPMANTGIFMHVYAGLKEDLAFISPCIAKYDEVNHPGTPDYFKYNVTFQHLKEYLERHNVRLGEYEESEFDDMGYGLGSIYPRPGGLKENVEVHVKDAWIHQCEGPHKVYDYLSGYAKRVESGKPLPILVDVLNCESGCNIGTGAVIRSDKEIDEVDYIMNGERKNLDKQMIGFKKNIPKMFKYFDENLKLKDFIRTYTNDYIKAEEVSEAEIRNAMQEMKKNNFAEQNFDCSACGYKSCKEMAKAIVMGYNNPKNCVRYKHKILEEVKNELAEETESLVEAVNIQRENNVKIFDELEKFTVTMKTEIRKTIENAKSISDIADRTKIVALNAGIEAARVGSNGNGFAVVADEVGVLASESKDIVQQTNNNNMELLNMVDDIGVRTKDLKGEMNKSDERLIELIQNCNDIMNKED